MAAVRISSPPRLGVHNGALFLLAILAALTLLVAACDSDDGADAEATTSVANSTSQQTSAEAPPALTEVVVYFINEDGVLVGERRASEVPDPLQAAISVLSSGPEAPGLFPALESGAAVQSVELAGAIALIDLNQAFVDQIPGGGSTAQIETLAPLVYTATAVDGVESVSLTVDGGLVDAPGLAIDVGEALVRDDLPIEVREPS